MTGDWPPPPRRRAGVRARDVHARRADRQAPDHRRIRRRYRCLATCPRAMPGGYWRACSGQGRGFLGAAMRLSEGCAPSGARPSPRRRLRSGPVAAKRRCLSKHRPTGGETGSACHLCIAPRSGPCRRAGDPPPQAPAAVPETINPAQRPALSRNRNFGLGRVNIQTSTSLSAAGSRTAPATEWRSRAKHIRIGPPRTAPTSSRSFPPPEGERGGPGGRPLTNRYW